MKRIAIVSTLALALLTPLAARAEVSVQVNPDGKVTRIIVLSKGGSGRIWRQVRGHVPAVLLLNPLGDTYGDLAPSVAMNPKTGQPWAIWPQNEGNRKRLVASFWNGSAWSDPVRIAQSDLMGYDQTEPRLIFDAAGVPYVFFTDGEHDRRVLFVTLNDRGWTPPLRLSDVGVDSSAPSAVLKGSDVRITFKTPAGSLTRTMSTTFLAESAYNLMDSPIPPGYMPVPPPPPGAPTEEPGGSDTIFRK
ncbi:MAG TPA: hypothetical protein VFD06_00710 [Candidatus Polarisedimenticolia bacterium]|nr:hypothetical protein [Candidatus Polarisedimenticolia bacterium]